MVFFIESIILCVGFGLSIILSVNKNPIAWIHDYPPEVVKRVKELGLIKDENIQKSKGVYIKKGVFCLVVSIVFAFVIVFLNKGRTFLDGLLISYGLWVIVNWFDGLVLDCLWFCHSKKIIIKGTEDMVKEYRHYWFYIKGALKGMVIGIPVCLLVGLFTMIVCKIFC